MAVYTEISDEELTSFVGRYDIGTVLSIKGIAEGVEKSNFLLVTEQGPFILTLYEERVDPADLPFFLGLMNHLAEGGGRYPVPVRDAKGEMLGRLAGRPAAIITFLQGIWVRRPRREHCGAVGAALAQLHLSAADFALRRENALSLAGWEALADTVLANADTVTPGLSAEISSELAFLKSNWPTDLPAGIIHADLFPDNVFFLREELSGLIDFYFACNDMFAYDLAICLNAWCFEPDNSFNVTKGKSLIDNYHAIRPLNSQEIEELPILARGAALRFLLTRLSAWLSIPEGALVVPKNPLDFYARLRFHRAAGSAGAYGFMS